MAQLKTRPDSGWASSKTGASTRLIDADSGAVVAKDRYLLFARRGTLLAQPFNVQTAALSGEPVPIADRVETAGVPGLISFSVSDTGVLAYGIGTGKGSGLQHFWVDREGKTLGPAGPIGNYRGTALSPDDRYLAAHRHEGAGGDVWVTDIVRGTTSRLTFDGAQHNSMPIWSPDGTQVAFASQRNGKWGIYKKAANNVGAYELLVESNTALLPESWSPDGRGIVYSELDPKMKGDLWLLPLSSSGATAAKPVALAHTPFSESFAEISPDGRWLAYASDETGRMEVYVRTFPDGSGKWAVSTNGGSTPHWRRDGRELFYLDRLTNGKIIGVSVDGTGSAFTVGPPRELLDSGFATLGHNAPYQPFSVSADGKRFLIPKTESVTATDALAAPIAVVLNWDSGLKK